MVNGGRNFKGDLLFFGVIFLKVRYLAVDRICNRMIADLKKGVDLKS